MLVLRSIVHQQQQPGGGQALDQAVEQGLGLRIDPVQILKDQQQGLRLAFPQQHPLERLQRALAPLRRIELLEGAVVRQGLQEGEQRGDGLLQGLVQRQHLPGDLGPDGARVVTLLDVGIALEQFDHREIGRGFAIGHRGTLQHQPALGAVGMDELIHQARLPHARLAHQRHDLAMPRPGPLQRLLQGRPVLAAVRRSGVSPTRRMRPVNAVGSYWPPPAQRPPPAHRTPSPAPAQAG